MRIIALSIAALSIATFALLTCSNDARAKGSFYYDLAGGIAKFQQTSPFFGSQTEGSTGIGFALNNGIFINFGNDHRAFAFQFGLQHRLSSAADALGTYSLQAVYPAFRFQAGRIYVGAGYTPFVWKRVNPEGGLDNFSSANATTSLLLEGGLLMPITPKFSFGLQAATQMVSESGTQSPKPAYEATGSFRFYFGFFGRRSGNEGSGEFEGRYPFGMIR
jgi:hypothetical protein